MSTDSEQPHRPQGASPIPNLTEALFGQYLDQCWVTSGADGTDARMWTGFRYKADRIAAFDPSHSHYFSIALIKRGERDRNNTNFAGGRLIVADDVGHVLPDGVIPFAPGAEVDEGLFDMTAPETSYEVETSLGNFQKGYVIDPPEPDLARWTHFLGEMKKHPKFGPAFRKCTPVHYVRMETGRNQPKPNRPRFQTKLAKPFTGLTYTLDELAAGFGIDMASTAAKNPRSPAAAGETLSPEAVGKLLDMIPDADSYDNWIRVGHAVYGATDGSEEGYEAFAAWSAKSAKFDLTRSTRDVWDSFASTKASATTLRVIVEEIYGPQSKERERASQIFAGGGVFGVLDEAEAIPMPGETETAKAEKEFTALLKDARKLVKIPAVFRTSADDANWLDKGGFVDAFKTATAIQAGSPTVFAPFDRGVVSTRTGAPFSGKSLLTLNQMAAFCAERPDLLGIGGSQMFSGDVLYFCNEDSHAAAVRRLQAWQKRHGIASAKHQLIIVRSELLSKTGDGVVIECLRVLETAVAHLRSGRSLPMIVVDTLSASVTGVDENSVKEMGDAVRLLKSVAWAFWAAVVFIHHGTKVAWKDNGDEEMGLAALLRGTGSLAGMVRGADAVRLLGTKEAGQRGWLGKVVGCRTVKASDDDMVGERFYQIETVPIDVTHPETGVVVSKGMPVCVPLTVVSAASVFADAADMADKENRLVEALGRGPVWVLSSAQRVAPSHGENLHDVWKCDIKIARQIVETWVKEGRYELKETKVGKGYRDRILASEFYGNSEEF